jgi:hypothetical protein
MHYSHNITGKATDYESHLETVTAASVSMQASATRRKLSTSLVELSSIICPKHLPSYQYIYPYGCMYIGDTEKIT